MDHAKLNAAQAALAEVKDGMVLGLGTGSTTAIFLEKLAERVSDGSLSVRGVPTSHQAAQLAIRLGIPLVTLEEVDAIHLAVDGCDAFDPTLDLIKGRGGAMVREKVVDYAAERLVILADEGKRVAVLGEGDTPVPVEVVPFAWRQAARRLSELGARWTLRAGVAKDGPVVTDNGNLVLDCVFGTIEDARSLESTIDTIPGVVGSGLFTQCVSVLYCGSADGVETLVKPAGGAQG